MAAKSLTKAQERVMTLMSRRWPAEMSSTGSLSVNINGQRVCNVDTMTVLERLGLVERDTRWTWKATSAGLTWPIPTWKDIMTSTQATSGEQDGKRPCGLCAGTNRTTSGAIGQP